MMITHDEQQRIWDEEHKNPKVLLQMDSDKVSGGVEKFFRYLVENNLPRKTSLEMGCGKGRNVIWLAQQGVQASGLDFSPSAVEEAKRRTVLASVEDRTVFLVHDATKQWPFESDMFDIGVDCFASTDIESPEGRSFATSEMFRVIRPGGHLLAYLLSPEDQFQAEMTRSSPAGEQNAFLHPTGKFEKSFDENEMRVMYAQFELVRHERIAKTSEFSAKKYDSLHHWAIFKKPAA